MEDNLVLRPAREEDDPALLDLFAAGFGRTWTPGWWKWISRDCPTGRNRAYVAEDPQRKCLASTYSLLPIRVRYNSVEIAASLAIHATTDPAYRGRGLFVRMGNYVLANERAFSTPITLGMPNPTAVPGHVKVGWDQICDLPFLVKHGCRDIAHRCRRVERFDAALDRLVDRIQERFNLLVLKRHRFLNWRAVDRPDKQYSCYVFSDNQDVRGYVVLKHFDEGTYRKSHIVDLHATDDDALAELLNAAESFAAGRDELNLWTNRCDPYQAAILGHGFSVRDSHDLLILHQNYGTREPLREGGWSFSLADNDVY